MSRVETVTGPIDPDQLGIVLPHEHILMFSGDELPEIKRELLDLKRAGGTTLVEMSTPALTDVERREESVGLLREFSQETGVQIVYGAGFYKEPKLPQLVREKSIDELAEIIVKELTVGVGFDGIKAGIIGEVGSSNYQIFDSEEKVLRAAARAHRKTGAAISTHTGRTTMVAEQLAIFKDEGADLTRVVIGHLDVYPHLKELMDLYQYVLDAGAYLQFDTVGKEGFHEIELDPDYGQKFPYDKERAGIIAEIVARGYEKQLLVSCDLDTRVLVKAWGGRGYSHLLQHFVPMLENAGVSPEAIRTILVDNPRRILTRD